MKFFKAASFKAFFSILTFLLLSLYWFVLPYDLNKDIFINLRLPKYLSILISGFSLALAGMLLQFLTKNPLADPFIIGTSGSSMLAIMLSSFMGIEFYSYKYFLIIVSFSLFTTLLSYRLAYSTGSYTANILLSGIALNSIIISILVLFIIFSRDASINFFHISFGSFSYLNYNVAFYSIIILLVIFLIIISISDKISIISFSEEKAQTLGIETNRLIFFLFLIISILTSISVSVSGIIGFIGLMIPHITRKIFREMNLKYLFLFNSLYGAIFLLISDVVVKRFFYPLDIPPGIISSIAGSLFFLWLGFKMKKL